jgi:3-isopropylmalate/(R)-2-methylmalate dehydratase large subunit
MADRFCMCNMAIEAGAKTGLMEPDDKALDYARTRAQRPFKSYKSDPDAEYAEVIEIDAAAITPQVALPSLPSNTKGIDEIDDIKIDQVVIGSCTNGRIEDMRIAAEILSGRKVSPGLRLLVIPATPAVMKQCGDEGLMNIFLDAGAAFSTPTCGPCLGGHMGILAAGEKAVATTNRNFVGRMGHPESEVYLTGPAVAAASAIAGKICGPDQIL